ncbi:activator-dependent family glycosyltransferase [Nocardiopsis ganjiahuensis]|uniref:activator-dependent family glycosyltransferase n=1 Tax=Nocardiopsis ganjiahuensis TaxID=239984 RepID=UPI00034AAD28|nr:activator-dependent family glycosyltransferase [Nocardiopsis ganjiahuensis]
MRIVFATFSEKTHFIGMTPLAWALRAAGHEVCVASQPELAPTVAATGLPFVSVGSDHLLPQVIAWVRRMAEDTRPDFDMMRVTEPERPSLEVLGSGYRDVLIPLWWKVVSDPMLEDLVSFCRSWRPDLVIWEPITFSAAIAAEACGAAHARFLWSLDLFAAMREQYLQRAAERPEATPDDPMRAWLEDRAARHGVEFSETLIRGQFTLDHLPASLGVPAETGTPRLPLRYVPYNGRAVVPDWLRTPPERPRVALSLGTTATQRLGGYTVDVTALLEGLSDLDVEVVATLPVHEQAKLGTVPGNVRLVDYVPLHALAPTCDAMITHGGSGTVMSGLVYGVPQVTVAHHMYDEPLVASLLAAQGAGVAVDPAGPVPEDVRAGTALLLEEGRYAESARRLREEIAAMPSPADVAGRLAACAGEGADAGPQVVLTSGT